jgi:hypothetical protein
MVLIHLLAAITNRSREFVDEGAGFEVRLLLLDYRSDCVPARRAKDGFAAITP